jgi:hypothetical protein
LAGGVGLIFLGMLKRIHVKLFWVVGIKTTLKCAVVGIVNFINNVGCC